MDETSPPSARRSLAWKVVFCVGLVLVAGCTGLISAEGDGAGSDSPTGNRPPGTGEVPRVELPNELTSVTAFGKSGIHRLSREEYRQTVMDLLGIAVTDDETAQLLPQDTSETFFDTDYPTQVPSSALVRGLKALAETATERARGHDDARRALVPCEPSSAGDEVCFRAFLARFGRRALRRPLTEEEVGGYLPLLAAGERDGDFFTSVSLAIRAFLQDMEFLYRIEVGTPTDMPGVVALTPYETASRLSFLLWGTGPDDVLLDLAESGELETSEQIASAAYRMMADARAARRIGRMHAMWLGYDGVRDGSPLLSAMRRESDALIERVVFTEGRPWVDLFTIDETFVDRGLAEHYGFVAPLADQSAWVRYPDRRGGILSHATVLSNGSKFGDTSPVQRGLFIRLRMLCQHVPEPTDVGIDTNMPPGAEDPNACKWDRYAAHRENAACAGCHSLMDPLGFGLENYDELGRYREHDKDRPDCPVRSQGELIGVGTFSGPAELGARLLESRQLHSCFVRQFYHFATGRKDRDDDASAISALGSFFESAEYDFAELLLAYVTAPAFRHRSVE